MFPFACSVPVASVDRTLLNSWVAPYVRVSLFLFVFAIFRYCRYADAWPTGMSNLCFERLLSFKCTFCPDEPIAGWNLLTVPL